MRFGEIHKRLDGFGVLQFEIRNSPFEMVMSEFAIRNSHEYVTVPGSPNSQFAIRNSKFL